MFKCEPCQTINHTAEDCAFVSGGGCDCVHAAVLVMCEFSGIVRDAFIENGYSAVSMDLIESESTAGPHIVGDAQSFGDDWYSQFALIIAHPPCTYLAVSGARWFAERMPEQQAALDFVRWILALPAPAIALENPISVISTKIRKPDQIVQPWMFGVGETKATCWWTKNLPPLEATEVVDGRNGRVWYESPGPERWKNRSRSSVGMAKAIAEQWGRAAAIVARNKVVE